MGGIAPVYRRKGVPSCPHSGSWMQPNFNVKSQAHPVLGSGEGNGGNDWEDRSLTSKTWGKGWGDGEEKWQATPEVASGVSEWNVMWRFRETLTRLCLLFA